MAAVALSLAGLCLLVFLGYAFVFTGLQEVRDQRQLLNLFSNTNIRYNLLTGHDVAEGQPVAVLEIPAIDLDQVVVKGTSATDLMKGPGLMADTALPGTKGNAVIAGRRSTAGAPFGDLATLRPKDGVMVVTGLGKFTYRVRKVGTVQPGGRDPIAPSTRGLLTLVTSTGGILPTGLRYVQAELVSAPASAVVPHHPPPASVRALTGDTGAVVPMLLWGLLLGLVLAGTVFAYRRWPDEIWVVYLLTTPVALAVALVWFGNLFRLLPATL